MAERYDVIVIGAGLGGLTAAALIARSGRKTLLVERNASVGGAASTYRLGDLVVEASLHETSNPLHPIEYKHTILARIGVLNAVEWVPTGPIYEVRGGPVGQPFILPESFPAAGAALAERFPSARPGVAAVLGDMERLTAGLGMLSRGRDAFRNPRDGFGALFKLAPMVRDWHRSVSQVFDRASATTRQSNVRRLPIFPIGTMILTRCGGFYSLSHRAPIWPLAVATSATARRGSAMLSPTRQGRPAARS